ncbi:MAG: hypothetical protein AAF748_03835 [Pseudomonadota bacterium]
MAFSDMLNTRVARDGISPIYVVYWTTCSVLAGLLLAPAVLPSITAPSPMVVHTAPVDHATHLTHDHTAHDTLYPVPAEGAPQIEISVEKDGGAGWNLYVETENFTFTPRAVNAPTRPNEGHAHIYINDEKLGRLYGGAYHIADLPPGTHVISVSLNGNAHEVFAVDGVPIAAEVTLVQPAPQSSS